MTPIRILIVDDEPSHAEAVRRALEDAGDPVEVEVVGTLREFREAVSGRPPNLVLLDLLLPDGRADSALVTPPESGPFPMVVMTSHGDEQVAVAAIRRGALDYVVKSPQAFTEMPRTVERALREWRSMQETRRAQRALEESERVLRMALETGQIGVFHLDLARRRASWSAAVGEIWGIPEGFDGDFIAHCQSRVHPEDQARVEAFYRDFLGRGGEEECEFRVVRPDGSQRWLRWRGRVDVDDTGVGTRVVGINLDITDRKRSEERLRQMSELQAALHDPATLDEKLRQIADAVVRIFGADFARIWLIRPGDLCGAGCMHAAVAEGPHVCRDRQRCLHLVASAGRYTHLNGREHGRVPFGCYKIGRVASGEETSFLIPDVVQDPRVPHHEWARELGLSSFAGYRIRPRNGETIGVLALFSKRAISAEEDAMLRSLSNLVVPVIEAARVDATLRANEKILNRAQALGRLGSWHLDVAGNRLEWSEETYRIFGVPPGMAMTYEAFLERVHPEDRDAVRAAWSAALGGAPYDTVHRILVNGEVRWIRERAELEFDVQGRLVGGLGTAQDITERRRSEEMLQVHRQRLEMALEAARLGVWEYDFGSQRHYWSPELYRSLGLPEVEASGAEMMRLIHPDDAPMVEAAMEKAIASQGLYRCEYRMSIDGRIVWVDDRARIIRDDAGRPVRAIGTIQNVTERKLLESQLRQAQKIEAIGQLAGGVAHDFNNILAAILMHLGLLEMSSSLDPETCAGLKELRIEAQRAASLTRQLLLFSRRSVMETRPLGLNEVVGNLLKMLGRLIGEQIQLVFAPETRPLPPTPGDPGMLEQVVMNLVVNARDAMPKGGRITLSTAAVEVDEQAVAVNPGRRPGRFVCLAVADTGVGIDEHTLKRIFEPFFTTKEAGRGTGLGLATVHGIIAQHRGWVEVESELGKGTTFRVYLPAATDDVGAVGEDPSLGPPLRGHETILVVEDEGPLRRATARTLESLGYRVHAADNGRHALALWREQGGVFDLVLTDMVMPEGMTGLELVTHLRDLKPSLKVIVSSGYSAELVRHGLTAQKGIRYLPKPYTVQALAEAIRAAFDPVARGSV